MAMTAIRQAAAARRKGKSGHVGTYRAMTFAIVKTTNANNGARTTCDSKKKRCKTNNADGAIARLRSVIATKSGPTQTKAITVNQKYHRSRRWTTIAPNNANVPAAGPNDIIRATI